MPIRTTNRRLTSRAVPSAPLRAFRRAGWLPFAALAAAMIASAATSLQAGASTALPHADAGRLPDTFAPLPAHPGGFSSITARLSPDGELTVDVRCDALAVALNAAPDELSHTDAYQLLRGDDASLRNALHQAGERLTRLIRVELDNRPVSLAVVDVPTTESLRRDAVIVGDTAIASPASFRFSGRLPPGRSLRFRVPDLLGNSPILSVILPGSEPTTAPAMPGEWSAPFALAPPAADPPVPTPDPTPPAASEPAPRVASGQGTAAPTPASDPARVAASPRTGVMPGDFVRMGFLHIVPEGLDHILFVVALVLLCPRVRTVSVQVTLFTLAHSLTLALVTLGAVSPPGWLVEPIIAASIVVVAVENTLRHRVGAARSAAVVVFGLIHGMGFAGALRELNLPPSHLPAALLGFNVGVELGQLAVVAVTLLALGWVRNKPWFRTRVVVPASVTIGLVAACWFLQRAGLF